MILMIDNYDSFTYNLVQYLGELGANIVVHRNDKISLKEIEQLNPEKIVISPGPCTPEKAGISIETASYFSGKIPILGVCLGHQSIARAFGGKII
ncbi:MAG: anthranilate/aminodeoxychorismate synthase component II, partial [Candidatus Poribacteria bacterium]|nr:anthranilate/aminodeoxychorismate synthase component II [Candidatus Poribacteria bacterium]